MPEVELIGGPYDGHSVRIPDETPAPVDVNFAPPNLARHLIDGKDMFEVYSYDGTEKARYVGQHERRVDG